MDTMQASGEYQASPRLEDRVYAHILEEITQRRIAPDTRLEEERYARACGVSRSPVRLALRRLEAEGVVHIAPGKGATVRSPSAEMVRQVLELRADLDGFVAAAAAQRIAPAQLENLRTIVAREREATAAGDATAATQQAFAFHTAIADAARQPLAGKFLHELLMRSNVYQLFLETPVFETNAAPDDHDRIIGALAEGDSQKARETAQAHVNALLSDHVRAMNERFRRALRRHSSTVTVLTYFDAEGRPCGMTATSVASLSATPPSVVACLNRAAKSRNDIVDGGKFGVNVLGRSQEAIAAYCSRPGGEKVLRPEWMLEGAETATPVLQHALAHLDCCVANVYEQYTHSLVIGDVERVWLGVEGALPLIYSEGAYGTIDANVRESYEEIWERVSSAFL